MKLNELPKNIKKNYKNYNTIDNLYIFPFDKKTYYLISSCPNCNEVFFSKNKNQKYCNKNCYLNKTIVRESLFSKIINFIKGK